jgi:hypothetical protein
MGLKIRILPALLGLFFISACAQPVIKPCHKTTAGPVAYVVGQGWHAELGIPVEQLGAGLDFYKHIYPGARMIMFGYGKKTFVTSPPESFSEYILGPVPGPAVIHVVGLRVAPPEAYPSRPVVSLHLTEAGSKALSAFIAKDLMRDDKGEAIRVALSHNPEGGFYKAISPYSLMHTCNTWTAEALHAAGLPVGSFGVSFSAQVMNQVEAVSENQCKSD